MADGFTLEIDADLARRIERKAEGSGLSREDAARMLLEQQVFDPADYTWLNGDPREAEPPYDPTTPTVAWEDVKARLRSKYPRLGLPE